ncbi:MAG: phosphoribosylformylglycinamidine cyclo-ligase [Candidatus Methylacidiphilales bacterium]
MKSVPRRSRLVKAYAASGVDVDLGNRVKRGLSRQLQGASRPEVLSKIGGFGGLFDARFKGIKHPVLVSSIDGVGTKLMVAGMLGNHRSIGADLVNHCVNDIAVIGAEPLFFLDYFGTGKLDPKLFREVIAGITEACKKAGCALIGGETAQMPGLYQGKDYDLVGAIVGVVDRAKMIDGSSIRKGDHLIGFPSSGLHTNGYSLARKVIFENLRMTLDQQVPGSRETLGTALLKVHINYQPLLKQLGTKIRWKGLAHITGGGFLDNIPRVLPPQVNARIRLGTWPVPPIFRLLQGGGKIPRDELYQVFNMGIGMVAVVSPEDATRCLQMTECYPIGEIVSGTGRVELV